MSEVYNFKIRPAGRHLLTIGRDLIQDKYAAVIELVKNAYDADSPEVVIVFSIIDNVKGKRFIIEIIDHGHGMTSDVVVDKWLVPSTRDKLDRKISPGGRIMQGRKGIGRYAASILGEDLLLETVTKDGDKTELYVEWEKFENAEFLHDVDISVKTSKTNLKPGTKLTMTGNESFFLDWNDKQFTKLEFELKKLVSPISGNTIKDEKQDDDFPIFLEFRNLFDGTKENENMKRRIQPYPIFELYDYKISGKILSDGKGSVIFHNNKIKNSIVEMINIDYGSNSLCGEIDFDIRVYDREKESINELINRGLKNEKGGYVGKLEARQLLNKYNGIGVYRNGFRIRPLGDPDFDWLELNKARIQNPSLRIGSNQVIGYVQIQSEEQSGLEEKSARDGLKENLAYACLKDITKKIIEKLEHRRFEFRKKTGLGRTAIKLEKAIQKLFVFDDIKESIRRTLKKGNVDNVTSKNIITLLEMKETDNNQVAEEIRKAVAIYQGQATLGKIVDIILHEGRRPLNFFKNQISNINFWASDFIKNKDEESLGEIISLVKDFGKNGDILVKLFDRLDPLAAGKRGARKVFNLKKEIEGVFNVFENTIIENKIDVKVSCEDNVTFLGWEQDFYIILTNLIDNSVFWIKEKNTVKKLIEINVYSSNSKMEYIDVKDTGPGIEKELIEKELIFEPEFTTKTRGGGSGLGLAIAGEAADRNNLELKAFDSETGAYFRLQYKDGQNNE